MWKTQSLKSAEEEDTVDENLHETEKQKMLKNNYRMFGDLEATGGDLKQSWLLAFWNKTGTHKVQNNSDFN